MRSTRQIYCVILASILMLTTGAASAKGCLKGAAVGAVAGHVAGHHTVLGAAAGCIAGHHMANKKAQDEAGQKKGVKVPAQPGSEANHV